MLAIAATACTDLPGPMLGAVNEITFDDVAGPYVELYGQPEDVYRYDSPSYQSVDYWWWTKGVCVTFVRSCYDDTYGWVVDSVYTFPPIGA